MWTRSRTALRAGGRDRRTKAVSPRAARFVGKGDANAVLRSCGARRGTRDRRQSHVRCRLGWRVLRDGAGGHIAGVCVMDTGMPPVSDFFARARTRLTLDVPAALTDLTAEAKRGDLDLDPAMWERVGVSATKPAVVLIPVVEHSEPTVLLTQRTADLPSHPGQIAFPGGKIDG